MMLGVLFLIVLIEIMMMMRSWFLLGLLLSSFDDMPEQVDKIFFSLRILLFKLKFLFGFGVWSLLN